MAEIVQIEHAEALNAIERANVDIQISTAKKYPRDIQQVINKIKTIAEIDKETAADCFYNLKREGKNIEGISVRMAEIIGNSWGNMRIMTSIIGNDGKTITARGECIDLENNFAASCEVKRRITTKDGRTYSEDMQVVTGNAAASIAYRNALFKVVPKAFFSRAIAEIKDVAFGKALDLETTRNNMAKWFDGIGINEATLCDYAEVDNLEQLDKDKVIELRGLANAINEGDTTAKESILDVIAERNRKEEANKEVKTAEDAVKAAMAKQG